MSSKQTFVTKEYFDTSFNGINEKFNLVMEKLDLLIGKYRNHEEEHTLLNGKVSEHSDDIEIIKEKLHIHP